MQNINTDFKKDFIDFLERNLSSYVDINFKNLYKYKNEIWDNFMKIYPEKTQKIIELKFEDNMTYKDIYKTMGISPFGSTDLHSLICRSKSRLQFSEFLMGYKIFSMEDLMSKFGPRFTIKRTMEFLSNNVMDKTLMNNYLKISMPFKEWKMLNFSIYNREDMFMQNIDENYKNLNDYNDVRDYCEKNNLTYDEYDCVGDIVCLDVDLFFGFKALYYFNKSDMSFDSMEELDAFDIEKDT